MVVLRLLRYLRSRYMLLRLFVKLNVYVVRDFVCSMDRRSVYNLACRIHGYLGNRVAMLLCAGLLKTSTLAMLFPSP